MKSVQARRYLAFDLEIAAELPDKGDWSAYRPFGITCAATLPSDADEPQLLYGADSNGRPAGQMSVEDARRVVAHLSDAVAEGYSILTWNGLGFDFDVLAEEADARDECSRLAQAHVDMMFHAFCELGYPLGLARAAEGMGLEGKLAGMSGAMAPGLWKQGDHDTVLRYLAQDVRATLQVAQACEERGELVWITRRGRPARMPLPQGWLTVNEARELPLPDTSWMDSPMTRERFTGWMVQD